ncbi:hypothetical protein SUGI_0687370 [Cryptomeria japonica]|nr:hypothetical protein SUGI_0687370 [Cryptomeria japonica]
MQPAVLRCASQECLCTSQNIHFTKRCADAGNMEACYTLGMLNFYLCRRRAYGISLLEKAANASHPNATFSMALIKFNAMEEKRAKISRQE